MGPIRACAHVRDAECLAALSIQWLAIASFGVHTGTFETVPWQCLVCWSGGTKESAHIIHA